MARIGIDVGSLFTKALVIADDRRALAYVVEPTTNDVPGLSRAVLDDLLEKAGIPRDAVEGVGATGQGRRILQKPATRRIL